MALTRYPDWPARLAEFLAERRSWALDWGRHDCALFACDAVLTMTGVDLAESFRGHYRDAIGAARALRQQGFRDLPAVAQAFAQQHGIAQLASPRFAQRGDVGVITNPAFAIGVLTLASGDGFVAVSDAGLIKVRPALVATAWRI